MIRERAGMGGKEREWAGMGGDGRGRVGMGVFDDDFRLETAGDSGGGWLFNEMGLCLDLGFAQELQGRELLCEKSMTGFGAVLLSGFFGVWIVVGAVFVLGTVPGLYGFGYDGVDCADGLLFAGLDVGEKSGVAALRLHHGLVPGEVVGPERALNPVYDGLEGAGSGRGRFVGVGLQATNDGNEDVDHFVGQVESICSVLVPRSIVEVFVIFMA